MEEDKYGDVLARMRLGASASRSSLQPTSDDGTVPSAPGQQEPFMAHVVAGTSFIAHSPEADSRAATVPEDRLGYARVEYPDASDDLPPLEAGEGHPVISPTEALESAYATPSQEAPLEDEEVLAGAAARESADEASWREAPPDSGEAPAPSPMDAASDGQPSGSDLAAAPLPSDAEAAMDSEAEAKPATGLDLPEAVPAEALVEPEPLDDARPGEPSISSADRPRDMGTSDPPSAAVQEPSEPESREDLPGGVAPALAAPEPRAEGKPAQRQRRQVSIRLGHSTLVVMDLTTP